jgi:hypothetical protein
VPQTGTGTSRCKTAWSENSGAGFGAAWAAQAIRHPSQPIVRRNDRVMA